MFSFDIENITKGIGVVTASFAFIGGGYTLWDKLESKDILTWAPEHFEVSDGPRDGTFDVVVAREKHRDDCSVEGFKLTVKDSKYIVHTATPSIAKFSGPASDKIDKFGYSFTIRRRTSAYAASRRSNTVGTHRLRVSRRGSSCKLSRSRELEV